MSAVYIVAGLALLWVGGELLVKHATGLAFALGLSPVVIGLTVVAFATSAPELAATCVAALRGAPELALGNVLGSNAANLSLVLGISALVAPIEFDSRLVRRDLPLALVATALLVPALADGGLGRGEGALMLAALTAYITLLVLSARRGRRDAAATAGGDEARGAPPPGGPPPDDAPKPRLDLSAAGVALGVGVLAGGAQLLVTGAVSLATALGVPDRIIGLTVVAIGTSLPELASATVASRRGAGDLVLGNLIGSNIFNVLCVLGVTALIEPITVAAGAARDDVLANVAITLLAGALLITTYVLRRPHGTIALAAYGGYLAWIVVGG